MPSVFVIGRFPPPFDGQTLATLRLVELLSVNHDVVRFNVSADDGVYSPDVRFRWSRVRHYARLMPDLRNELRRHPASPVLWTSISPVPLGHARDRLLTCPAFQPDQPVFAVLHRQGFERLYDSPLTRPSVQKLVDRLDGFVFLTESLSLACSSFIPENKRFVISNTIDEAVLFSDDEVLRKLEDRRSRTALRILYLSNMIESKGYLDVLQAVGRLRDRAIPVEADFAGRWTSDGDRDVFEGLVTKMGLTDRVSYHGGVTDRRQIKALYRDADVFVLPTYYPVEAQPLSIIEAMNAGLPIVTTNHGGISEIVQPGREALIVPPRSPEAIADALVTLADIETWRRYATNAHRQFTTRFAPEPVRRQWEALVGRHLI